ncbi:hypothetical protein [Methanochimaera problematica]|nr:hypothetical protein [Methanoplanus sp. FWC-SCC4]
MIYDKERNGFFCKGKFIVNNFPIRTEKYTDLELFLRYFPIQFSHIKDATNWSQTIQDKYNAIRIAFEELKNLIDIYWKEYCDDIKIRSTQYLIALTLKYETFMNCIYSFCESLAMIIKLIYPKMNLTSKFSKLRSEILSEKIMIDDDFCHLMKITDWYDEVHWIRTEATHSLFGFLFFSKDGKPGYLNQIYNKRKGVPSNKNVDNIKDHIKFEKDTVSGRVKIEIDNIDNHIDIIFSEFNKFLFEFGKIGLKLINFDLQNVDICFQNSITYQIGTKLITINDIKNDQPGICTKLYDECPMKNYCKAYTKAS